MIIPKGDSLSQTLTKITKTDEGHETELITGCVFVKLIGKYGWKN